jgi:hypothetical protein
MLEYSDLVFRVEGGGAFRRVSAEEVASVTG